MRIDGWVQVSSCKARCRRPGTIGKHFNSTAFGKKPLFTLLATSPTVLHFKYFADEYRMSLVGSHIQKAN